MEHNPDTLMVGITDSVRRTGLSRTTLYRLMEDGRLDYVTIGSRRLIPEDALRALVAANRVTHSRHAVATPASVIASPRRSRVTAVSFEGGSAPATTDLGEN